MWGDDTHGIVSTPPSGSYVELTAGLDHACALDADGEVTCWGRDDAAQVAGAPTHEARYRAVAAGSNVCAIRAGDGSVVCFGSGSLRTDAPAGGFGAIATGTQSPGHGCAVSEAGGAITCWGDDTNGIATSAPAGAFAELDGTVACWGDQAPTAPVGVSFDDVAGGVVACGIQSGDGTVACWGGPVFGGADRPPPGAFTALVDGSFTMCGRRADGSHSCWGGLQINPR